jgi:hypothetical protein
MTLDEREEHFHVAVVHLTGSLGIGHPCGLLD